MIAPQAMTFERWKAQLANSSGRQEGWLYIGDLGDDGWHEMLSAGLSAWDSAIQEHAGYPADEGN